jgi:type II secretory pathway pseudopilin PulG
MSTERGDAAAKILLLLLLCAIAGAVAAPWFLRSKHTPQETKAIATLRRIHAAQTDHYGASRLYATITMLKDAKRLPTSFRGDAFESEGYRFAHQPAGGWQRWCAQAVPKELGGVFAIDESGIVKEFPAGSSPCFAGELQSPGTPVR